MQFLVSKLECHQPGNHSKVRKSYIHLLFRERINHHYNRGT